MDEGKDSPPTTTKESSQLKQVKACDACHAIKIKCVQDEPGKTPCGRCARLNMPCTFTPRVRKKQQKRTDARVASLEREVEILRSALAAQVGLSPPSSGQVSTPDRASSVSGPSGHGAAATSSVVAAAVASGGMSAGSSPADSTMYQQQHISVTTPKVQTGDMDSISRGIGSAENVQALLEMYSSSFSSLHFAVQLDASWTPQRLAEKRPLLLQAMISVTSLKNNPRLSYALQAELTKSYLASLGSEEPKTIDLVQALLISVAWYVPPLSFHRKMRFYQLGHIAMSTAVELGLGTEEIEPDLGGVDNSGDDDDDGTALERARAFLGCYQFSQGVSMTMRRPSMLRSADGVDYCMKVLETSPMSTWRDRVLCYQTRLFQIAEEMGSSHVRTELAKGHTVSEEAVLKHIQHFRDKLFRWHEDAGITSLDGIIALMYHYNVVFLSEIGLYSENETKDFVSPVRFNRIGVTKPPSESLPAPQLPSSAGPDWTRIEAATIPYIVRSAHNFLDLFIAFDASTLRTLPVSNYFRLMYIIFVLTKLFLAAGDSRSALGRRLDRAVLKTDHYRDAIMTKLTAAADHARYPVPALFLQHLSNLTRCWREIETRVMTEGFSTAVPNVSMDVSMLSQAPGTMDSWTLGNAVPSSLTSNPMMNPSQAGAVAGTGISAAQAQTQAQATPPDALMDPFTFTGTDDGLGASMETWSAEDLDTWAGKLETYANTDLIWGGTGGMF